MNHPDFKMTSNRRLTLLQKIAIARDAGLAFRSTNVPHYAERTDFERAAQSTLAKHRLVNRTPTARARLPKMDKSPGRHLSKMTENIKKIRRRLRSAAKDAAKATAT